MKGAAPHLVTAIGVMSGTSMDGIDVAVLSSDGESVIQPGPGATFSYPDETRTALREIHGDPIAARAPLVELERAVTEAHVAAVQSFMKQYGLDATSVALVGLHGQTILHRPRENYTRQLMDGAHAAQRLGLNVVCDFRSADVAAGGEGAPFAPLYHAAISAQAPRPLAVLNWGGVGNVTYLGASGEIVAFDTGPANALLDDFLLRRRGVTHDADGALAASGRVDQTILAALMGDPYFERRPPKSLDRNQFHASARAIDQLSDADGAATLAAFTVEATAAAARFFAAPALRWLVTGGGRRNRTLMAALQQRLGVPVEAIEAIGCDGDSLEAHCFAYLAIRSRRELPLSLPTTTGAPRAITGGAFWPGGAGKAEAAAKAQ
jgi:anhydro-N-acetylmuramic acid kinase